MNGKHLTECRDPESNAGIVQFEMAFRQQNTAPPLVESRMLRYVGSLPTRFWFYLLEIPNFLQRATK
ncbi:MAG: hypothetical protein AAF497_11035 [Planctomycetota bacterium]